jgi:predicted DNA binding CopG/RHH family protein
MARLTRGTRRPLTDEDKVWRDFKAIMRTGGYRTVEELAMAAATQDSTDLDFMPEIDLDDLDLDGQLPEDLVGLKNAPTTSPKSKPAIVVPVSGTRSVTIRVRQWVLRDFKAQAEKTGIPYQTLMNRALADEAKRFL